MAHINSDILRLGVDDPKVPVGAGEIFQLAQSAAKAKRQEHKGEQGDRNAPAAGVFGQRRESPAAGEPVQT